MSAHSITSRGLAGRKIPQGTLTPMGTLLFSASEQGAWYDPSDLSTLFQDAAGATPVTAVEQPVGRILDKSGRGNHATQATTTKRPVLSRRVNQMPSSSGVGVAPWQLIAGNTNATSGTGVLPVVTAGVATLDGEPVNRVILSLAGGTTANDRSGMFLVTSVVGPFSVCIKSLNATPSATLAAAIAFNTGGTKSIVSLTDGWVRIDGMSSFGTTVRVQLWGTSGLDYADFLIGKASLTLATDAHLPYQRVNTDTDYDADPSKFPAYRRLDGVDDSHASATGGGGTAGFFFSASVTPLGGAGTARTLFSDAGTNTGYIVRLNASNQLELAAGNGTAYTTIATSGTLAVGTTDVVQAWDDGTNLNVKIGNGATASIARPTVSAGTTGYTMGQDNGASTGYFNGRIYSTIYRKDSGLTQVQREAVALYQRQKARMP